MQLIILGLIIFLAVSLLGVGLFYVGTKLLYNISTDISNASITTKANKGPNLPTIPDDSNVTTTTPASGNLELWSETGFQGNVTIVPLSDIQAYESLVTTIDTSSTKSIRYPPNGYQGYYYVPDTLKQLPNANDIKNNGRQLTSNTSQIQPIRADENMYIAIFSTATTSPIPTTSTPSKPPSVKPNNFVNIGNGLCKGNSSLNKVFQKTAQWDTNGRGTAFSQNQCQLLCQEYKDKDGNYTCGGYDYQNHTTSCCGSYYTPTIVTHYVTCNIYNNDVSITGIETTKDTTCWIPKL